MQSQTPLHYDGEGRLARLIRLAALPAFALLLAGCANTAPAPASTAADITIGDIPVAIHKPEGPGPFPAVVILHDCSGRGPASSGTPARWSRELVANGYVTLMPDSFSTRGFPNGVCTDPSPARAGVAPHRRVQDAYATLAYARTLPYVDGKRVGVMGNSHGGASTVATLSVSGQDPPGLAREKRDGFVAGIALYPGCGVRFGDWRGTAGTYKPAAPLLILIGEKDDWTPAPPCEALARSAPAEGFPVSIKVYPGAHHAFDNNSPVRYVATRMNANAPGGRGATTGGDPAAWADAVKQVNAFFNQYLRE